MISSYNLPFLPYGRNVRIFSINTSKNTTIWNAERRVLLASERKLFSTNIEGNLDSFIDVDVIGSDVLFRNSCDGPVKSVEKVPRCTSLVQLILDGRAHFLRAAGPTFDLLELHPVLPFLQEGPAYSSRMKMPGKISQIAVCGHNCTDDSLSGIGDDGPLVFAACDYSVGIARISTALLQEEESLGETENLMDKEYTEKQYNIDPLLMMRFDDGIAELAACPQDYPVACFLTNKSVMYRFDCEKGAVKQFGGQPLREVAGKQRNLTLEDFQSNRWRRALHNNRLCYSWDSRVVYAVLPGLGLYRCDERDQCRSDSIPVENEVDLLCLLLHHRDPSGLYLGSQDKVTLWDIRNTRKPICAWDQSRPCQDLQLLCQPTSVSKTLKGTDLVLSVASENLSLYIHAVKDLSLTSQFSIRPAAVANGLNQLAVGSSSFDPVSFFIRPADMSKDLLLFGASLCDLDSEGIALFQLTSAGDLFCQKLKSFEPDDDNSPWLNSEATIAHPLVLDQKMSTYTNLSSQSYFPDEDDEDLQMLHKIPLDKFLQLEKEESKDSQDATKAMIKSIKKPLLNFLANRQTMSSIQNFCSNVLSQEHKISVSEMIVERYLLKWGCKKTVICDNYIKPFHSQLKFGPTPKKYKGKSKEINHSIQSSNLVVFYKPKTADRMFDSAIINHSLHKNELESTLAESAENSKSEPDYTVDRKLILSLKDSWKTDHLNFN